MEWISADESLPENRMPVLCFSGRVEFIGNYTKGYEIDFDDDEDHDEDEFDEIEEKHGKRYLKPGWYELSSDKYDDDFWHSRKVTHWMPLPEPPKV